jgi:superfamily II RNA helicase
MRPNSPEKRSSSQRHFSKKRYARSYRSDAPTQVIAPSIHRETACLLSNIGKPESAPFVPDPFQMEALDIVSRQDVVVSAPTGSGKTWIALEAAKRFLAQKKGVWYATPLKALSNSKYKEFGDALGKDQVGILTGDRKENPDAPLIVGTTEILRNQLYDAMDSGKDIPVDMVILDEAHYLGDIDRGVVWEEVLIYLPPRVRLLLLSATISNAHELARWLEHVRNTRCAVVVSGERPVPLHVLCQTPSGQITPFLRGNRLFPSVASLVSETKGKRRLARAQAPDYNLIIESLRQFDLLPAIIFLKSRSDCDRAIESLFPSPVSPNDDGFSEAVKAHLEVYPELRGRVQVDRLLECRAGAHHAGLLPAWRLLVEQMMVQGYLEAIFSTSTVAAGVNFPARTVVLLQSDRFDGRSFIDMSATDLHQMTGRAGRRGMDNVGFVLVVPGKYMNLSLLKELFFSPPEPLRSQITINFSMVLNLLLSHDPRGVNNLLGFSFASFHQTARKSHKVQAKLIDEFQRHLDFLAHLAYVDEEGVPTFDGRWAAQLRLDHPLLIAELIRTGELRNLSPQELAAVIAPFVVDKDKVVHVSRYMWDKTKPLWKKFRGMLMRLKPLIQFMISRDFPVPDIMFWPVASVFLWAEEVDWNELITHVGADEGDLAMVILRTADHLRQLMALSDVEPEIAATARTSMELIMKPPLV